ncbi:toxin-antitoxin system YwqK family antitoxin [Tellurirhabdus bombi]|uniref:toxin-antitoxin system YwqK family antitoxin n=1 Tax=Tellurirhabdus bombi TaxID=2907205 RepID=UPI001F366AA5|nr:hypothetical protein [Tellurirhabdus bombi]
MIRIALVGLLFIITEQTLVAQTPATTTQPDALTTSARPTAIPEAKKTSILTTVEQTLGVEGTVKRTKDEVKRTKDDVKKTVNNTKEEFKKTVNSTKDQAEKAAEYAKGEAQKLDEFATETLPDLGLKLSQAKKENTEKKKKSKLLRTEYEGLPITEAYTKFGSGDKTIIEKFTVLKQFRQPSPYVREIYWYDAKEQRVRYSVIKDKEKSFILHGPYKRYQNGNLIEEGYYYVGAKDGRWERYDGNFMLSDKVRYSRGFPAESQITYYDSTHTKIKEVLPKEYGKLHGTYFAFYESGQLAAEGRYDNGTKVGRWTEYYPHRRAKKKTTQYAPSRWEDDFEPYLIGEWDEKGKVVYERPKEKVIAEEEQ